MRMKIGVLLLSALAWPALAQNTFELPRECLERQVPDPSKCVIQDGPPQRVYPATRNLHKPAATKVAPAAGANTPSTAPSAPFRNR